MPKPLVFRFDSHEYAFQLNKVDRARLYGFKELEVKDESDQLCELATLAEDGRTLIGKGGTGVGYVDSDGNWADKSELVPVNLEGDPMEPVASSFQQVIALGPPITVEEFLNHNIRLVYQLVADAAEPNRLTQSLAEGSIYQFDYSFRGGLEPDAGFLLRAESGELFFLVGDSTAVDFVGLQQQVMSTAEDELVDDADTLMDFGMI